MDDRPGHDPELSHEEVIRNLRARVAELEEANAAQNELLKRWMIRLAEQEIRERRVSRRSEHNSPAASREGKRNEP
jgi:hypothetical protein